MDWMRLISDAIGGGVQGYQFADNIQRQKREEDERKEEREFQRTRQKEQDDLSRLRTHADLADSGAVQTGENPAEPAATALEAIRGKIGGGTSMLPGAGAMAGLAAAGPDMARQERDKHIELGSGWWQSKENTRPGREARQERKAEEDRLRAEADEAKKVEAFGQSLVGLKPEEAAQAQGLYEAGLGSQAAQLVNYFREFEEREEDRTLRRRSTEASIASSQASTAASRARTEESLALRGLGLAEAGAKLIQQQGAELNGATLSAVLSSREFDSVFGPAGPERDQRARSAAATFLTLARGGAEQGGAVGTDGIGSAGQDAWATIRAIEGSTLSPAEKRAKIDQVKEEFERDTGQELGREKDYRSQNPRD